MADILGYHMPDDLYYHPDHTWARAGQDDVVVGLDDFFGQMVGGVAGVALPPVGVELIQGQAGGEVECQKWVGVIAAPVAGVVTAVNELVELSPELISEDCYGEGWLWIMKPTNLADDLAVLFHGEAQLDEWLTSELNRLDEDEPDEDRAQ